MIHELIARDKNHPYIVVWSIANEAAAYEKNATPYFYKVAEERQKLDPTRPITMLHDNDTTAYHSEAASLWSMKIAEMNQGIICPRKVPCNACTTRS